MSCESFPPLALLKQDTGQTGRYVEQFLKPMLADLNLHTPAFDENNADWQKFLLFVEFEQPLAAKLLKGRDKMQPTDLEACFVSHAAADEDDVVARFFQAIYPFLVRFPARMLALNPPQLRERLREMAATELFAELLREGFALRGNVSVLLSASAPSITFALCPTARNVNQLEAARKLSSLGVELACANFGPNVGLGPDSQAFRDQYLQAWEFRDWVTLIQLLRSVGINLFP
jgi:hypothetical protein